MTVLLVLFTLIIFLIADHFVQKTRRVRQPGVGWQPQSLRIPEGVSFARNHTWSRKEKEGTTTLGLDELMGRLVGAIDEIILPPINASVTPATAAFSIRQGGKTLSFAPHVAGRIVEVNSRVASEPRLAQAHPYDEGWLIKVQPANTASRATLTGNTARVWLQQQTDMVKEFLSARSSHAGLAFMQDGGLPAAGILSSFDEEVWTEFQKQFASLSDDPSNSRKKV